jgi:hypothetical protein
MTRISDMTPLTTLPAAGAFVPVEQPGSTTNYRYDLSKLSNVAGLLVDAPTISIPTDIDFVSTTGADVVDHGGANYTAGTKPTNRSGFTSANGRNFVLSREQVIVPQMFYQATDPDFQNAMQGAVDYLHTQDLNGSGGDFYKGSQKLFIPAGNYNMHAALDILHTLVIEGEGSGQNGPGSGGCSRLKWTVAGTSGLRIQAATTEGDTTISGATHDGSGGGVLRDFMLEGPFDGTTEGDFHGLVIRNAIKGENLYIRNWPGEGVHAWAGAVIGFGNVAGNVSTTRLDGVKTEGNRGGIDIRGTDANVCTVINSEVYLNRQYGYLDDNGAGSNVVIGMHAATNGQITGSWAQTQCSSGGNRYALKYGGDPTIAPSGTTADTANWLYMQAGGAIANTIPAWTATPGTFRAGFDYGTLNSAGVLVDQCYSEGGGFSQFNNTTLIVHSAIGDTMYRGGHRIIPQSGGLSIRTTNLYIDPPYGTAGTGGGALAAKGFTHTMGDNASATSSDFTLNLDATTSSSKINFRTAGASVIGYIDAEASNGMYCNAPAANGWIWRVGGTQVAATDATGVNVASGLAYYLNGTKVVGAQGSAITRLTRTATSGSLPVADGSITIANAATPTVVELLEYCTEIEAKLETLTARFRAATGHGLIA